LAGDGVVGNSDLGTLADPAAREETPGFAYKNFPLESDTGAVPQFSGIAAEIEIGRRSKDFGSSRPSRRAGRSAPTTKRMTGPKLRAEASPTK
jgi:hypothetical protein